MGTIGIVGIEGTVGILGTVSAMDIISSVVTWYYKRSVVDTIGTVGTTVPTKNL